jgi:Immunoglobulin-like domain of bacterial spore germination/Sporulation and spore germination
MAMTLTPRLYRCFERWTERRLTPLRHSSAMVRLLLAICVLPLLLAGCGLSRTAETATTTAAPPTETGGHVPVSPAPISVVAYFLRDGRVAPVRMHVPQTRAVATAALGALLGGPPDGYETALADGTTTGPLTIDAGVAKPQLSGTLSEQAKAQVVFTLTQFPTVTGVALPGSGEPLTRADFESSTPRILVESPLGGDRVTSPIRVAGTSNDTEATFQLELRQGERVLASTHVTASSGNGVRGTFEQELAYDGSGPATLVAYERNAGEGPPQLGRVEIPVELG